MKKRSSEKTNTRSRLVLQAAFCFQKHDAQHFFVGARFNSRNRFFSSPVQSAIQYGVNEMIVGFFCLVFMALLIFAAAHDVRTMTIPNWVSVSLAVGFIPAAAAAGLSLSETGVHLGVGAIALLAGAGLFFIGVWGGGDAKLVAATALWAGAAGGAKFLYGVALFGGILALVLIIGRRLKLSTDVAWVARLLSPKEGAPYGVAIAAGGIWAASASPVLVEGLKAIGL